MTTPDDFDKRLTALMHEATPPTRTWLQRLADRFCSHTAEVARVQEQNAAVEALPWNARKLEAEAEVKR